MTESFDERGIAAFFLLSGRSVETCDMAHSARGCRLNSLASDTRDDVPQLEESVSRFVTSCGRRETWSGTTLRHHLNAHGGRLGTGNSHEILLHRDSG